MPMQDCIEQMVPFRAVKKEECGRRTDMIKVTCELFNFVPLLPLLLAMQLRLNCPPVWRLKVRRGDSFATKKAIITYSRMNANCVGYCFCQRRFKRLLQLSFFENAAGQHK